MSLELETAGREVLDPVTGEIVDLSSASIERLAQLTVDTQGYRENLNAFERELSDALLDHCDKNAQWTLRVGDPKDRQFELKTASPTAGTEVYPPDRLRDSLQSLVEQGVVAGIAAESALQRRLVLELEVPWDEDPQALASKVKGALEIHVAGVRVSVVRAEPSSKVSAAGVKALRKIPGAVDALNDALVTQDPPKRRVKVTEKRAA